MKKGMRTGCRQGLTLLAGCVFWLGAHGTSWGLTTYIAIDLNPPGVGHSQVSGTSGGQQVGSAGGFKGNNDDAFLWTGTAASGIDLNPSWAWCSRGAGVGDGQQVGQISPDGNSWYAALWAGSAASAVYLHPGGGYSGSTAFGVSQGRQVGSANGSAGMHAMLWSGSAESAVNLNPSGFGQSEAMAISGLQQVGYAQVDSYAARQPILWTGTAASAVNLMPGGCTYGVAKGVGGGQQVGLASSPDFGYWYWTASNHKHAFVWSGTAQSAVDLNPADFYESRANATNGIQQVGEGSGPETGAGFGPGYHALVWSGTADSAVDLHAFLPSQFVQSFATGIDADGNIVGYAVDQWGPHAILWQPVPEPATLCVLAAGGLALLKRWPRRTPCLRP